MARLVVVANKSWEADPLVTVLASSRSRPDVVSWEPVNEKGLRGFAHVGERRFEIRCLEDVLARPDASRSDKKAEVLQQLLGGEDPATAVVAFGTAATIGEESRNGCVVVGTNVFLHDPKSKRTTSTWPVPNPDTVPAPTFDPQALRTVFGGAAYRGMCEVAMLPAPVRPAELRTPLVNADFVALATVNVTNYSDYAWADDSTVTAFRVANTGLPAGSVETTHGVIRACTSAPFLFVSGITDRVGHFSDDVDVRAYAQNFAAAHNAGIALTMALPGLAAVLA